MKKPPHIAEDTPVVHGSDAVALRKFLIALSYAFPLVSRPQSALKDNKNVMFLPDIAYRDEHGQVIATIQAWVYQKVKRRGLTRMLALFLGINIARLAPELRQRLYERTQLFRVVCARGKTLRLKGGKDCVYELDKTAANGRTSKAFPLTLSKNIATIKRLEFCLIDDDNAAPPLMASAFFAPPTGISVISDIDDTIKETAVGDTRRLLINTFLGDFTPTKDVDGWYRELNSQAALSFHYVSASPIQLYPVLKEFMDGAKFPEGSMHLREATRWTDIVPRPKAAIRHKKRVIERILGAYPQRKFMLIGDSTEHDPQIYAGLYHIYREQICAILIREVSNSQPSHDYAKIFADIPANIWCVSHAIAPLKNHSLAILKTLKKP